MSNRLRVPAIPRLREGGETVTDEKELNRMYELGKVVALEDLAKEFHRRSGEAYASDKYDQARELKSLGSEFTKRAEKARDAFTKMPRGA